MTIDQGMERLKESRSKLSGLSVLNPALSAREAWEVVWTALVNLRSDYPGSTKLSAWLQKRVQQVSTNRFNPLLPDLTPPPGAPPMTRKKKSEPVYVDAPNTSFFLLPGPEVVTSLPPPEAPAQGRPVPAKPRPFDRKFS